MKRKIYDELLRWKNNNSTQALLIKGARQVGKTHIIKEFGKNEFKHLLSINFEDQKDLREAFEKMPNPDEAVKAIQAYGISKNIFNIEGTETLIFLDEVQRSRRTYSLLKPLTEMSRFKIIASGSLLGINLNDDFLDPGPSVRHIEMMPMDFEEFLWAVHGSEIERTVEMVINDVKKGVTINDILHRTLNNDIKDYIIVGGMPKAVLEYVTSKDIGAVYQRQEEILRLYRSDIQRYQTTTEEKIKTLKCFDSMPNQFSKDNHRFLYTLVEAKKGARYLEDSIIWLEQTGNTRLCYHVNHFKGSLIDGKGKLFKLYMNDIGLLVCMLGREYVYRIQNNELGLFKGALYEQLLAQFLVAKNRKLYYARINEYEIDFLIENDGDIIPIECKSGGNTKSKSLQTFVNTFNPKRAFKISSNNVNIEYSVIKALPHYVFALMAIEELAQLKV